MPINDHPIVRNVLSLSSGEFASRAIGFVAVIYLGRTLGTSGLGVIGFATALLTYFSLLVNPGLETVGLRDIAANPSGGDRTVTLVLSARTLLLFPAGALFALVLLLSGLTSDARDVLLAYGATLLLLPLTLDFHFMGHERMGVVAVRKILQALCYLCGLLLFVEGPSDLIRVPLTMLGAIALSLLIQPFALRRRILRFDRDVFRSLPALLRSAMYIGGSQLLLLTYLQADLVMCGFLLPARDVGLYTAAQRIVLAVSLLPVVLLQAWMPELSRAEHASDRQAALLRFSRAMVLPGLLAAGTGVLLAPDLIRIVFGNSYLGGGGALRILFLSVGFVVLNMALANPLLAWKRDREYFLIVLGGAVLNVALNAVLIPMTGIIGAAWATVAAEGLVLVSALRTQRSLLTAHTGRLLLRPLFPAAAGTAAAAVIAFAIPGLAGLQAAAFIAVYGGGWLLQRRYGDASVGRDTTGI